MANIKIITDSTCDLPAEIVSELGITVIPCYVNMSGKSYLDGVELTRQAFFERLPEANPLPTTSAPGMDAFIKAFQQAASEGATGIITIHISETLSNIYNVAKIATQGFDEIPVVPMDSGQLSMGLGLLAMVGAQKAKEGADLDEVKAAILEKKPLTNAFAKLDTLEYLRRGGRLSDLQHSIVSMLDIKPITKMNNGVSGMEMVRTRTKAYKRLIEIAQNLGPAELVGIIHADAEELAMQVKEDLKAIWPDVEPMISIVTPAIGSHVGPGTVCIASVQKEIDTPLFESRMHQLRKKVSEVRSHIPGMSTSGEEKT